MSRNFIYNSKKIATVINFTLKKTKSVIKIDSFFYQLFPKYQIIEK